MTLLGKTMLNLDGAIRVLSPELDPVELIRNYMLDVMLKRVGDQLSPGRVFAWVLDMKHLFENSPRRDRHDPGQTGGRSADHATGRRAPRPDRHSRSIARRRGWPWACWPARC